MKILFNKQIEEIEDKICGMVKANGNCSLDDRSCFDCLKHAFTQMLQANEVDISKNCSVTLKKE